MLKVKQIVFFLVMFLCCSFSVIKTNKVWLGVIAQGLLRSRWQIEFTGIIVIHFLTSCLLSNCSLGSLCSLLLQISPLAWFSPLITSNCMHLLTALFNLLCCTCSLSDCLLSVTGNVCNPALYTMLKGKTAEYRRECSIRGKLLTCENGSAKNYISRKK